MSEADIEVIMKSIHNPSCVYLCQHLTTKRVDVTDPVTEIPEGWDIHQAAAQEDKKSRGPGDDSVML